MNINTLVKKALFSTAPKEKGQRLAPELDEHWRVHTFRSGNVRLSARFGPAIARKAKGTVVCAHPLSPDGKDFFLYNGHAEMLRYCGYNVFLFDFNGFGDSPVGSGYYAEDIVAAGRAARRLAPDVPLALLGISFGAAWSLRALGSSGHPYTTAVLEAGYAQLSAFPWGGRLRKLSLQIAGMFIRNVRLLLSPVLHIPSIRAVQSILFVHGARDYRTPASVGRQLVRACEREWKSLTTEPHWYKFPAAEVQFWLAPRAGHADALLTDPRAYLEQVIGFLDKAMDACTSPHNQAGPVPLAP